MQRFYDDKYEILRSALNAGSPTSLLFELGEVLRPFIDWSLFTVLRCDHKNQVVERILSSDEEAYPVGGTKPFNPTVLTTSFFAGQTIQTCFSREDIVRVYSNDPKAARYCGSINVPVVWNDSLYGMLNLLSERELNQNIDDRLVLMLSSLALPLFL